MGDLPEARVDSMKAFSHIGMEFIGPYIIKIQYKCKRLQPTKMFICLFICMANKSVHLEVVKDLSSDTFLAAITNFILRHRICSHLYSDSSTNFVGATPKLKKNNENIHRLK